MATGPRHGAAAVHGDGDSDDARSMPSEAPSASAFSGDLDSDLDGPGIFWKPVLTTDNKNEITQGDWQSPPRGDGYQHAQQEKSGTFGILSGNWGSDWADPELQRHMNYDLKSHVCNIIILQEAKHELLTHLKAPGQEGIEGAGGDATRGSGANWLQRPTFEYIGFRGTEIGSSLLICARKSLVEGMLLRLFWKRADGTYRQKKKKGGEGGRWRAAGSSLCL